MSEGDGIFGQRSLETIYTFSHNLRVYHSSDDVRGGFRYQDTSHYFYINQGVYHFDVGGRGVTRYQDTSHSSSHNIGATVDVYGRGGYRYQTRKYSFHKLGGRDRLLSSSVYSFPIEKNVHGDKRVGYRRHYDIDKRGDRSVDYGRRGYRSKETSHPSSHNME